MLSREGGMDIESVAKNTPEKIHKIPIDPLIGMPDYLAREAAFCLFDDKEMCIRDSLTLHDLLFV